MPTSNPTDVPGYSQWEIWQVSWRHEDGTVKERPALLISSTSYNLNHDELWFAKITSQDYPVPFKIELSPNDPSFKSTGLTKRCFVYVANSRKISKRDIVRRRGSLGVLSALMFDVLIKQAFKFPLP